MPPPPLRDHVRTDSEEGHPADEVTRLMNNVEAGPEDGPSAVVTTTLPQTEVVKRTYIRVLERGFSRDVGDWLIVD